MIGGGGAGALASIEASGHEKLKIILACKGPIGQSGLTPTANGGTKAIGSAEELFKDMIIGGSYLNDQDLVWFMVNQIPRAIEKLKKFGIPVMPLRGKSACVPSTETLKKLRDIILHQQNIELLEDVLITSLLKSDKGISGATALDLTTGIFFVIQARAVILATGGLTGELYPHTSNNPFGVSTFSSGTGHVMAYLAGAELIDMEMIQFVPLPANPKCLYLRYFPEFWAGPYENHCGEIIESDVKSYPGESYSYLFVQKLFRELEKGNGPIYIDQRNSKKPDPALMIKSWEMRRKLIKSLGIDPRDNRIEILLGSHFGMGGVRVNPQTETSLPGFFAAGEVMGGVHGGMRLSGYSLTQMIVFGLKAGEQAAAFTLGQGKPGKIPMEDVQQEKARLIHLLKPKPDPVSVMPLKKALRQVMQDHGFIIRDQAGLTEGMKQILNLREDVARISVFDSRRYNLEWIEAIEFSLMIEAAEIIMASALKREESRGFHYRKDFSKEDNTHWLKHTLAKRVEGRLKIDSAPVVLDRMRPMG